MAYKDRYASEWISLTDNGIETDSRVILYEGYGGNPELDVNIMAEKADVVHNKYTFRVTAMADRECVFRKSSQDGQGIPSEVALKALARFGWKCNNYSIESLRVTAAEQVGGTLRQTTQRMATIVKHEYGPAGNYPFFIDVLEECMSALRFVSTTIDGLEDSEETVDGLEDSEETDTDMLDTVLTEEPKLLKEYLIAQCKRKREPELILTQLANRHYDMDLSQETIDNYEITDLPQRFQPLAVRGARGQQEELANHNFDQMRDLATEISDRKLAGTGGINRLTQSFELHDSPIVVDFVKIKCIDMPYIIDHKSWHIPTTNDIKKETLKQAVMMRVRENNPELRFARSTEQAREMIAE